MLWVCCRWYALRWILFLKIEYTSFVYKVKGDILTVTENLERSSNIGVLEVDREMFASLCVYVLVLLLKTA